MGWAQLLSLREESGNFVLRVQFLRDEQPKRRRHSDVFPPHFMLKSAPPENELNIYFEIANPNTETKMK